MSIYIYIYIYLGVKKGKCIKGFFWGLMWFEALDLRGPLGCGVLGSGFEQSGV